MKKLALIFMFISAVSFAQKPITTKLGDFDAIKVYNGLTVELIKASTAKIVITGEKADDVSVKNSDGLLKIRLSFPDSFTAEGVKIVLYYTKNIQILDVNEGANIIANEPIKQQLLEVKTQEGGKINLKVDVKYLTVKSVSGGIIKLNGTAQNQTVEVTTGGVYEAFDLESEKIAVTAASGGNVEVNATEVLDAKVRFGGTIYYIGTPDVLKTKKIIGGTIKQVNDNSNN